MTCNKSALIQAKGTTAEIAGFAAAHFSIICGSLRDNQTAETI
jgi:hypothetical protein